jgi:hypothetical protein
MRRFFNNMEERFVFPIGRRSWQVLSLLALIVLGLSIIYFLINSTPTTRESVMVNKSEVIENQIDTAPITPVAYTPRTCFAAELSGWIDSIKADLPNNEWLALGDSSAPYTEYAKDEYGYYIQDEYGNYASYQKRDFIENPKAIPNFLNEIFSQRGYDSSNICEMIEVLGMLHFLNNKTDRDYLERDGFFYHADYLVGLPSLSLYDLEKGFKLKSSIELRERKISNKDELMSAWKYIKYSQQNNLTEAQIDVAVQLIQSHAALDDKEFPAKKYFELAEIIFESSLDMEDLAVAIKYFIRDIKYYDQNDLAWSLKRYLKLYGEKVMIAKEKESLAILEKQLKRTQSLTVAGGAFLSVVAIASILLLFSIQSLLKSHVNREKE